jgi:hypothetical protein
MRNSIVVVVGFMTACGMPSMPIADMSAARRSKAISMDPTRRKRRRAFPERALCDQLSSRKAALLWHLRGPSSSMRPRSACDRTKPSSWANG